MTTHLIADKISLITLPPDEASAFEKIVAATEQELALLNGIRPPAYLWKPNPRPEYERIKCNDLIFVFKYDDKKRDMLHIYSRHMTTPDDVISLFFSQDAIWDEERQRFGNYSETHGLYWFWRNEEKKVIMVISCFKRQPSQTSKGAS